MAAKPPADGFRVVRDEGPMSADSILRCTAACKLPSMGGKTNLLAALQIETAADLQRFASSELQASLGLSATGAARVAEICRGQDNTPVKTGDPKKSVGASSWLTDADLSDLAMKSHSGRGGAAIFIGDGWLFEPHTEVGVSNHTRARWLLLSLLMDLDERVVEEFLEYRHLPTKLTISYVGPGCNKEPGMPGFTDGQSRSRSVDFPTDAYRSVDASDVRATMPSVTPSTKTSTAAATPLTSVRTKLHPVYGTAFIVTSASSGVSSMGVQDGPEILENPRYCKRIAALVDTTASLISSWAKDLKRKVPVAHMSVTARAMAAQDPAAPAAPAQNLRGLKRESSEPKATRNIKRPRSLQCSLEESLSRAKMRASLHVPVFDVSDTE
eukprot:gnl/TRDRNA2_/TRDRNA2_162023_c0_seq1.p1 gnl/TRDRNA2_/TRDRNA2_162023_c0~~gnl/TRDRNA2_/TRDRNA2_162023_c0_seq1.p1  ORF type:complete len:437 (-),score=46.26 gnl/TRDRNA2_/TRDRNA2_162023_c0_seq1:69-1220(-)